MRSSIRPPFRLMEPIRAGLSIFTRGDAAIAASRDIKAAAGAEGICTAGEGDDAWPPGAWASVLPGFLGRAHVKKLPADKHSKRKRNSEDKVSVVFHNPLKGDLRSACSRPA